MGCNLGSGEALQRVPEGKLAPPGAELVSESAHDGPPGEAIVLRFYAPHGLTVDEVVAAFYERELQAAGWERSESARKDQISWSNRKHTIILNLATEEFDVAIQKNCCERYK